MYFIICVFGCSFMSACVKNPFCVSSFTFHSLHIAFCFDTFHCDDITFFMSLRTQNLHDNLFPSKIYSYFFNMADNERSRGAAALLRRAANLLNPSNPSNQSSSSVARIVIEDTESNTSTNDTAPSTSSAIFTSPSQPQHRHHYLVSHQVVVYKILSPMRSFKDYLLLCIHQQRCVPH